VKVPGLSSEGTASARAHPRARVQPKDRGPSTSSLPTSDLGKESSGSHGLLGKVLTCALLVAPLDPPFSRQSVSPGSLMGSNNRASAKGALPAALAPGTPCQGSQEAGSGARKSKRMIELGVWAQVGEEGGFTETEGTEAGAITENADAGVISASRGVTGLTLPSPTSDDPPGPASAEILWQQAAAVFPQHGWLPAGRRTLPRSCC